MRALRAISLVSLFIIAGVVCVYAASEVNGLTFINKSGDLALVKLVGPSRRVVEVADVQDRRVQIACGTYLIYVRYEDKGLYRYAKGESFVIHEVTGGYVEAQPTLHGVVNGNYALEGSSENEFNRM